jgi:hypothetical protein
MPTRLESSIKFFGQFTPKDLARLAAPALTAVLLTGGNLNPVSVAVLVAVGITWYGFRPYNQPLDTHLYHGLRFLTQRRRLQNSVVDRVEDDHLILENGAGLAVLSVSPTNLEMKTGDEQEAIRRLYRSLLHTVTFPIEIHSHQEELELEQYIQHLESRSTDSTLLKQDYIETCQTLTQGSLTTSKHYIVVRVTPDSSAWLRDHLPPQLQNHDWINLDDKPEQTRETELDSRCREIIETIDGTDLGLERLTGKQLTDYKNRFDPTPVKPGPRHTNRPDEAGGSYQRTLYISEYPSSIDLGWTIQLLQLDAKVDITQRIQPQNSAKTTSKLQRLDERLNAEIDSLLHQGHRGTNKLETRLEDTQWFLQLLADRDDQPVDYSVTITIRSKQPEACRNDFEKLKNRLRTKQVDFREPVLRTDQALKTVSPFRTGGLNESLLMPAGSAATGFPFGTRSTDETRGVVYGVDTADQTPVLLNRFQWSSHSLVRMGMVGSGKSYATKTELLRAYLAYPRLQIYVVDPKQEYQRIIRELGGTTHTLKHGSENPDNWFEEQVAGFTVEERGRKENVDSLVSIVEDLYTRTSQNQDKTLIVVDEARILLNDQHGRNVLNQFVLEGRDVNTALTLVTQNASHFTQHRQGREILDNTPGKVFMRHNRVPDSVVDYFRFSQREKQGLYELKTGTDSPYSEALLKISGRLDTHVRIDATPQEHAIITADKGGE